MAKVRYKEIPESMEQMVSPGPTSPRSSIGMEKAVGEFYYISTEKLIPYKRQAERLSVFGKRGQLSYPRLILI